jgi:DNA invertase Pin-like site-specific DNA recombinase
MAVALAAAPATTLRAAIYARVSTPGQKEDGYALDGQVTECLALAERIGASVAPDLIFHEVGSGANWDLPKLLELLDRAQRGEFDVLITLATSRLARDVGKLAVLQRTLKRAGVAIEYVQHRFEDSPTGQLTETMMAAIDVYERQNSALRFALGKRAKLARNLVMGVGPTPYGYRAVKNDKGRTIGLEIDPETGPVVRRIFREAVDSPLQEICARLEAEGIAAPGRSGHWLESAIRDFIANPVYQGRSAYGRHSWHRVIGPDGKEREVARRRDPSEVQYVDVPALVTTADAKAAEAAIAERRRRHANGRLSDAEHPYTLRSLLSCGLCGGPLAVTWNNHCRYYECLRHQPTRARIQGHAGCPLPAVPADDRTDDDGNPLGIEAEAWRIVRQAFLDENNLRAGLEEARAASKAAERQQERIEHLKAEIRQREKALEEQVMALLKAEHGSALEQALRKAGDAVESEVRTLRESLAELEARPIAGLSDDDMAAIEEFAARTRAGLERAGPAERHQFYKLLRLRGTVREDPENGIKFRRRRFSIDWETLIELRHDTTRLRIRPGT